MATIHYTKTWTGADRDFQASFVGPESQRDLQEFYLGGYSKLYLGNYTKTYAKVWTGTYGKLYEKVWSKVWIGQYSKQYTATYTGVYSKSYEGQFTGSYSKVYAKVWTGNYAAQYGAQWIKAYDKVWVGTYTGTYSNNTTYLRQYTGQYTANYVKQWSGVFAKLWSGSRTYDGQYGAQYEKVWTGQYEGAFTGYYTKAYVQSWTGVYDHQWSGSHRTYRQEAGQFAADYTKAYQGDWSGAWVGQYDQTWGSDTQYSGQYAVQTNYVAQWIGANWYKNWVGPTVTYYWMRDLDGEPDVGPGWSQAVTQFSKVYQSSTDANYTGITQWTGVWIGSQPNPNFGYQGATWVGATGEANYEGFTHEVEPSYPYPQFFYSPMWYTGTTTSWTSTFTDYPFTGVYQEMSAEQWAGNVNYVGQYNESWEKAYTGYFDKDWSKLWSGTRFFTSPIYYNQYTKAYTGYFDGQTWNKVYSRDWVGQRDHDFTAQYAKLWSGSRTFSGQYGAQYEGLFAQAGSPYSKQWTGVYEGAATYGAQNKTTGASFEGVFTGYYTGYYEKAYGAQYTKLWSGSYTGYYTKVWQRQWTGVYTKAYEGTFDNQWTKTYEGSFVGNYVVQYGKAWTGTFNAQYNKLYLGNYVKTYSSVFLGQSGSQWTGTENSTYTKAYTGATTYNTVYTTTTNTLSTKTGHLNQDGKTRVKSDGAWKEAEKVHIKKNGTWHETKSVFVKENGAWKIVNIGWERTDINITSNQANFNLRAELDALSKAPATVPQLVNIYIDGADVYSTSSTPAMDLADGMGAINIGGQSIKHLVRVFVHPDARIIGMAGSPGGSNATIQTGYDGGAGGDAIKTNASIELFIENYGIIAGGGGAGGTGGYPVSGTSIQVVGGAGGYGAGYASISGTVTNILENNSLINGTNATNDMGIHGGSGGLLGQRGAAAGGYKNPNTGSQVAADGALKTKYEKSGNGGVPGAAIVGYDASRVTFINTGNVWGDSKYKYRT